MDAEGPDAAWRFTPPSDTAVRQLEALAVLAESLPGFNGMERYRLEVSVADGVDFIVHPPVAFD